LLSPPNYAIIFLLLRAVALEFKKVHDMKELQYPFEAGYILSKKKSIRRQLLSDGTARTAKRIAILGGYYK
jgi:hypothetical protein